MSNILPLQKRRSKDVIKIVQEWSVRNTSHPKRCHNKDHGFHNSGIHQHSWEQTQWGIHHTEVHPFCWGAMIRVPCMRHTRGEVLYYHRGHSLGKCGTGQSRCMRSHSPHSRSEHGPLWTDHHATQGNTDRIHRVSQGTRSRKGASPVWHRQWCSSNAKEAIHQLWQCNHTINDTTPSWEDAIKMTTSQKFEYKAGGYRKQWDPTTSIMANFTGLDKFWTSLADHSIATSIKEMTMAAGARMWESKMFTKDQMVAWENKTIGQQTWQNLQDYFTEKWLEQRQYLQANTKHLHFKDAALTAQE
jgi:hypothetical protein